MSRFSTLAAVLASTATGLDLITFDGSQTYVFTELNDPVMGGQSSGTWNLNKTGEFGVFDGEVKDVPALKAPGFIKAAADGTFADASSTFGGDLVLTVRTSTPEFQGFKVAFVSGSSAGAYACAGGGTIPFSRGCYKSKFTIPAGDDFTQIRVPFNSFSDKWSPATGEQTKTCADDADVCITAKKLKKITRFEIWAEGALGKVHLELLSISAEKTATYSKYQAVQDRPPVEFDSCKGPIQGNLRYGISGRTTPDVPVAVDDNESLATAVCCDSRTKLFAEPQFLFQAPDIDLFGVIGTKSDSTVFYDSACGLPLFRSPINRTLGDFQDDTNEHGWPSFRTGEVYGDNVITDFSTGDVRSSCGTHLGSYLPDEAGARWCIDLSCVSGNPN